MQLENFVKTIPANVISIMRKLERRGYEAYIVGGAVRDFLFGLEPSDYDIFTNATGDQILNVFSSGKVLGGEERQAKILTVVVDGVEVSQYRANGNRTETATTLDEHLATCDFTMNAMAVGLNGILFDYYNGQDDIENKILCCVYLPSDRFKEDPLRLLRGVRFCNKYDLTWESLTSKHFEENLHLVNALPKERVSDELKKILPYGIVGLNEVFQHIFPAYNKMQGVDGGMYHNETVLEHAVATYEAMLKITDNPLLLMVALLHDVGKPRALHTDNGNNTFHGHEVVGANMVADWMKEYKFSNKEIEYVRGMIMYHMYDTTMGKKSALRFFDKLDRAGIPVEHMLFLRYADANGNFAKKPFKFAEKTNDIVKRYYEYKYGKEPFRVPDLEINGYDCMKIGLEGKDIGEKLNEALELVQDGLIENNRRELMSWLRNSVELKEIL